MNTALAALGELSHGPTRPSSVQSRCRAASAGSAYASAAATCCAQRADGLAELVRDTPNAVHERRPLDGATALHVAAMMHDETMVSKLLALKADPTARDNEDVWPRPPSLLYVWPTDLVVREFCWFLCSVPLWQSQARRQRARPVRFFIPS